CGLAAGHLHGIQTVAVAAGSVDLDAGVRELHGQGLAGRSAHAGVLEGQIARKSRTTRLPEPVNDRDVPIRASPTARSPGRSGLTDARSSGSSELDTKAGPVRAPRNSRRAG